ncbi:hypothetical protein VFA_000486 [Vibrio furnissii CIP 102972]|nr:hypothetical protein VFA_000486 [Vibrio furnissii CIP 102972]
MATLFARVLSGATACMPRRTVGITQQTRTSSRVGAAVR